MDPILIIAFVAFGLLVIYHIGKYLYFAYLDKNLSNLKEEYSKIIEEFNNITISFYTNVQSINEKLYEINKNSLKETEDIADKGNMSEENKNKMIDLLEKEYNSKEAKIIKTLSKAKKEQYDKLKKEYSEKLVEYTDKYNEITNKIKTALDKTNDATQKNEELYRALDAALIAHIVYKEEERFWDNIKTGK